MLLYLIGGLLCLSGIALFHFPLNFNSKRTLLQESFLSQQRTPLGSQHVFPLILEPRTELSLPEWIEWLDHHYSELEHLLEKHQAILFRNFPISDAYSFHDMVEATHLPAMDYIGGAAVRKQFTSRVVSSNESPPSEIIPFHHEMAQTPHPPTHSEFFLLHLRSIRFIFIVFFYCDLPAQTGGETPILSSTELYQRLLSDIPEFIREIETQGVKYIRTM